ncbi:MAG TPA: hypothetical protein VJT32_11860 [bacterium]|nr:hypothetical protein [bacterium]
MSGKLERFARELARRAEALEVPQAIEDVFSRYRDDPVGFCRDILGAESATRRSDGRPYQFDILQDLAEHPRLIVKSGHGVGKSALDAWASLWWLLTRPMSRVVIVAPEFSRQVRTVLFSEMRRWARRSKVALPLSVMASRAVVNGYGEEWAAIGLPATEPDRIEGLHAEAGVLLILDETKGIPQDAYDALQGALTSESANRLLVTSTPGGPEGPFYRAWSKGGDAWVRHQVPSTDSSIVSPAWVEDRARDWGLGSPLYQARVLGEFPDAGEGVLFPLTLLEAAVDRVVESPDGATVALGVDVARSVAGDASAIAVCRGPRLESVETFREPDTMRTVDRVLQRVVLCDGGRIWVDATGVGAGVVDRLNQLGRSVEAVHFGGGAVDPKRFKNKRAELFWLLREGLERGKLALPDDDELLADLSALRYRFDQQGRIVLESKDEVRQRLGRSPDRGDAVALACAGSTHGGRPLVWVGGEVYDLNTGELAQ